VHDHPARRGNFLGTLIRHFLTRAVLGLELRVLPATLAALLIPAIRFPPLNGAGLRLTLGAAVDLAVIAPPADVENRLAVMAPALAEAVLFGA
jgi:hypothetical protein